MSLSKMEGPVGTAATTFGTRFYTAIVQKMLPKIGERWTFALLWNLHHEAAWYLWCVPFLLADKYGFWDKYRIQKGRKPDPETDKMMWREIVKNKLTSPLLVGFVIYPLFKLSGMNLAESIKSFPSWTAFLRDLAICFIGEDTLFYWTHRALHSKLLYKYHKQHHAYTTPVAPVFEITHPVEAIFGNLLSVAGTPLLLNMHPYTFLTYFFLRISEAVSSHSGYNLPYFPFNYFENVLGGAERHDFHHSHNYMNYGSLTKFWDWACGTDKKFWEFKQRRAAGLVKEDEQVEWKE